MKGVTFLISLVSIQRSILSTVEISMCSLEMELSQAVKLSRVARKSTQVNFKILNILLMMLSKGKEKQQRVNECKYLSLYFCLELDSFFLYCLIIIIIQSVRPCHSKESLKMAGGLLAVWAIFLPVCLGLSSGIPFPPCNSLVLQSLVI